MKKLFALLLVVSVLLSLCACKTASRADDSGKTSVSTSVDDEGIDGVAADEDFIIYYDENGDIRTVVISSGQITMTDHGILGTRNMSGGVDYCLANPFSDGFELQSSIFHIEKQSYETSYSRVERDGFLYTLACVGDVTAGEPINLYLIQLDLKNKRGTKYLVTENGWYYGSVCCVEDRVYVFFHDQRDDRLIDRVIAFDPETSLFEQALTFELNKALVGESVRYVFSYDNYLGILKLKYDGANDVKMYVTLYNKVFLAVFEYEVTNAVRQAAGTYLDASDVNNELIQNVAKVAVIDDDYLYYENFSATKCLINLNNDRSLAQGSLFTASSGSGRPFFANVFDGTTLFELSEGALVSSAFTPKTPQSVITEISRSPSGNTLIKMLKPDNDPELYCFKG